MGAKRKQLPLGDQPIGHTEQREELRRALGQTTAAHLLRAEQILDDVERILDLGTDADLRFLDLLVQSPQLRIRRRRAFA